MYLGGWPTGLPLLSMDTLIQAISAHESHGGVVEPGTTGWSSFRLFSLMGVPPERGHQIHIPRQSMRMGGLRLQAEPPEQVEPPLVGVGGAGGTLMAAKATHLPSGDIRGAYMSWNSVSSASVTVTPPLALAFIKRSDGAASPSGPGAATYWR